MKSGLDAFGGFRKFLLRGNVVDLAVGVVIGAAFNGLVQGMVTDLIQPLIARVSSNKLESLDLWKPGDFLVGHFIGLLISFLITAAVIYFLVVMPINALHDRYNRVVGKKEEVTTKECPFCISSIPLKATRCPACTSNIPATEAETKA